MTSQVSTLARPRTATPRGALYTRQSHDPTGQGMAVGRQEDRGRKTLAAREVEIVALLCDNDLSASGSVERPDFERLITMIERREIDFVWALRFDRLARNQKEGARLLQAAYDANVFLLFDEGMSLDLRDPMARAFAEIMLTFAALEVGIKGQRQKLANRQRATLGKVWHSSPRPFGWLNDRVTPHPVEGPAVVEAYNTMLGGGSIRSIVVAWSADPALLPPQGAAAWTVQNVKLVLFNPRHAGKTSIAGEILGDVECGTKLVELATFEAVGAILAGRAPKDSARGVKSMLGGIVSCPCGGKMTHTRNRRGQAAYRHQPVNGKLSGAGHVARRAAPVDDFIARVVAERFSRDDAADLIQAEDAPDTDALRQQRTALLVTADEIALEHDNPDSAWSKRQLQVRSRRNAEQIAEIDAALQDANKVHVFGPLVGAEDPLATFLGLHVDQQRTIIRALFASITLDSPGMGRQPLPTRETTHVKWRDQFLPR